MKIGRGATQVALVVTCALLPAVIAKMDEQAGRRVPKQIHAKASVVDSDKDHNAAETGFGGHGIHGHGKYFQLLHAAVRSPADRVWSRVRESRRMGATLRTEGLGEEPSPRTGTNTIPSTTIMSSVTAAVTTITSKNGTRRPILIPATSRPKFVGETSTEGMANTTGTTTMPDTDMMKVVMMVVMEDTASPSPTTSPPTTCTAIPK